MSDEFDPEELFGPVRPAVQRKPTASKKPGEWMSAEDWKLLQDEDSEEGEFDPAEFHYAPPSIANRRARRRKTQKKRPETVAERLDQLVIDLGKTRP